jgi:hypothetical protein
MIRLSRSTRGPCADCGQPDVAHTAAEIPFYGHRARVVQGSWKDKLPSVPVEILHERHDRVKVKLLEDGSRGKAGSVVVVARTSLRFEREVGT